MRAIRTDWTDRVTALVAALLLLAVVSAPALAGDGAAVRDFLTLEQQRSGGRGDRERG